MSTCTATTRSLGGRRNSVRCKCDTTSTATLPVLPASPCHLLWVLSMRAPSYCLSLVVGMMRIAPVKNGSIYEAGSHIQYNLRYAPSSCLRCQRFRCRVYLRCQREWWPWYLTNSRTTSVLYRDFMVVGNITLLPLRSSAACCDKHTLSLLYRARLTYMPGTSLTTVITTTDPRFSIFVQLSHCCCILGHSYTNIRILGTLLKKGLESTN